MNESLYVPLISAISGIAIAYIVNVASKKVQKIRAEKEPKDRMEQMFDGYERLIKQKDIEDGRKAKLMLELEDELSDTRAMVRKLENSLAITHQELGLSRKENKELRDMLVTMRKEYELFKDQAIDGIIGNGYNKTNKE